MTALLLLSAFPLVAGALRLIQLAGGAEVTSANARFFTSPIPVVLHIVSACVYALGGAFQMGAAWVVNLAVAEWAIRKWRIPRARTASAVVSHLQ